MFHACIVMEDCTLTASEVAFVTEETRTAVMCPTFNLTCTDAITGKSRTVKATLPQLTAIIALGFGGVGEDNDPAYNSAALYDRIKGLFAEWPNECRPIP